MGTKKLLLFVVLLISPFFHAQKEVLAAYPDKQDFYPGGNKEFSKEMVRIVQEKHLLPCEKKDEEYVVSLLINHNGSVNYVKDPDSSFIQKNKCAYEFSRKMIPYLRGWVPAKEKGQTVSAIIRIAVNPFKLYYSKTDPSENITKMAIYKKGGLDGFSFAVKKIFEKRIRRIEDKSISLFLQINERGEMGNFVILSRLSKEDIQEIIVELSAISGGWFPSTFNGVPTITNIHIPVVINFD